MAFLIGEKLTAARLNEEIRSILVEFGEIATVSTAQSTASTSFVNLTTTGPTVTLISEGTLALCFISCRCWNTAIDNLNIMGVDVSGATTIAATASAALVQAGATAASGGGLGVEGGILLPFTINPGSNTYQAKYRAGTGTANFADRKITVFAP